MENQQVTEKILADAKAEAQEIKKNTADKVAAEKVDFEKRLDAYQNETETIAEKKAAEQKEHMLASQRMKDAKEYLAEKRKILDDVFDKAKEEFMKLPDDQYKALMKKLIEKAVETGDEEVVVDENEKAIDQELIKQINRDLGPGYKGNLRLSESKEKIGKGFILRRGNIQTSATLDVLLQVAQDKLEIPLADELFK